MVDALLPGRIAVFVVDGNFQPAAAARVSLSPGSRSATTGANGRVVFERLPVQAFTVEAESADGRKSQIDVDLRREAEVQIVLGLPPAPEPPDIGFHRPQNNAELLLYAGDPLPVFMTFFPGENDSHRYQLIGDRVGELIDTSDFGGELQVNVAGLPLGAHRMQVTLSNQHELADSLQFLVTVTERPSVPVITGVRQEDGGVRVSWTPSTNRAFERFVVHAHYPEQPQFSIGKHYRAATDTVWYHENPLFGYDVEYRIEELLSDHDPLVSQAVSVPSEATFAELEEDIVTVLAYPQQHELLVVTYGDQRLHFIDQASMVVKASLALPGNVNDLSLDPDGRHLFIASSSVNEILVVDLLTRSVTRRLNVPVRDANETHYGGYVDAFADPYLAYSGFHDFSDLLILADKFTGEIRDTLISGLGQRPLITGPDGRSFYVNRMDHLEKYRLEETEFVLTDRRTTRTTGQGRGPISADDRLLLFGYDVLRTDDLNVTVRTFPQLLLGMNAEGTLVSSGDRVYTVASGDEVLRLPFPSRIVALGASEVFFVGSFEPYRTRVYRMALEPS